MKKISIHALGCTFFLAVAIISLAAEKDGTPKVHLPFNGQDLTGWKLKGASEKSKWVVGQATVDALTPEKFDVTVANAVTDPAAQQLVNRDQHSVNIYTAEKYGDCRIELEFMIPKGSNSGIYVMGEYEIQIADSFGKDQIGPGDLGGLYGAAAPRTNASKAPGEWQSFLIDFQAPKFQGETKTSNARFLKIVLNGQIIHENVELKDVTRSGVTGKESATGPLMFQGNHGEVAFRNIKITATSAR